MRYASDSKEHLLGEAYDYVARLFDVSEEDRKEPLPSGQDNLFTNRVRWAKQYLTKAGLLESPRRGSFKITEAGSAAMQNEPAEIDFKFLGIIPNSMNSGPQSRLLDLRTSRELHLLLTIKRKRLNSQRLS